MTTAMAAQETAAQAETAEGLLADALRLFDGAVPLGSHWHGGRQYGEVYADMEQRIRAYGDACRREGRAEGMDAVQRGLGEWADGHPAFAGATPRTMYMHAEKEMREELRPLILGGSADTTHIAEETADVVMILMHLAHRLGFSLSDAIAAKFEVCKARQWQVPDADGVVEHVRAIPAPQAKPAPVCPTCGGPLRQGIHGPSWCYCRDTGCPDRYSPRYSSAFDWSGVEDVAP